MKIGISSAEIRLASQFLKNKTSEVDTPNYRAGYTQAIEDMSGLLIARLEENMMLLSSSEMSFEDLANDVIDNPSHYKGRHGMEAIDVVRNFVTVEEERGFYLGNTLKYLLRHHGKNGLEDLKKARKNLDWLIEHTEKEQGDDYTEVVARAWLDGYEVEKEKLYTVEILLPYDCDYVIHLSKNEEGKIVVDSTGFNEIPKPDSWRHSPENQLTESEIKQDFEWAWQFAEEVTDDTEV